MSKLITKAGRLVTVGVFAVALVFGARQAFASTTGTTWCDTPDGVCADDIHCYWACWYFAGTPYGGACELSNGCCMCLY